MKTFKYTLNFDCFKEEDKPKDLKEYPSNLVVAALRLRFKDGLSMDSQRRLFKIMDKMDNSKDFSVELEDAEFELIDDAFKNAKFPPELNKVVCQMYDFIDAARK